MVQWSRQKGKTHTADCDVRRSRTSTDSIRFLRTCGDLADVGFGRVALGVVPGPVEITGAEHGDAAFVSEVTGLPGTPVGEEDWPAIRPGVL